MDGVPVPTLREPTPSREDLRLTKQLVEAGQLAPKQLQAAVRRAGTCARLPRYTHRVALSNDRLLAVADGRVRFRWRDYADGDRVKVMDLEVEEFLVGGQP